MSEWQDIATAPRDGSHVLLINTKEKDSIAVCYWDAYYAVGGYGYEGGDGWVVNMASEEYRLHCNQPTHWMPRPDPPKGNTRCGKAPKEAV